MAIDYYKTLEVDRSANEDDLKKSYRKLVMKWHPDKNPNNKKQAEAKFKQISEAYDVLSDPQKRAIYDQYGHEGLEGNIPPTSGRGAPTGCGYSSRNADDVFAEFFEGASPLNGMGRGANPFNGMGNADGPHSSMRGLFGDNIFASFRGGRGGGGGPDGASAPKKAPPIEKTLIFSLEDLYKGTTKKLKISRDVIDRSGRPTNVEEMLTINVKPGWKKGTKITFEDKGNMRSNLLPADLSFIIDERPHSTFKRDGNDLIFTQKITLLEALTGCTVQLTTLDGRNLTVPINSIVSPDYEEIVQNEGMPIAKEPSKKGNLRIRFEIKFPARLTSEQKTGLKRTLSP